MATSFWNMAPAPARAYFFNFNGTAGILRKSMIDDAGGWQHDTLTEDSDLSYRAQLKGWRFVYMPGLRLPLGTAGGNARLSGAAIALGEGPYAVRAEAAAQHFKSGHPLPRKAEAFLHLTPNISYPLMIVVSALMLPVMIVRFYMGWLQMVFLDLPLIIASFRSISAFYVIAQRELYPEDWKRAFLLLPMLMAVGVALTIINTRAVLEALFGVETSFVRTPKYAIEGSQPGSSPRAEEVPRPQWLATLRGVGLRHVFLGHGRVRHRKRRTIFPSRSSCFSSADTTGLASATLYSGAPRALGPPAPAQTRIANRAMNPLPTAAMVVEASLRIRPLARRTPVMTSRGADERSGKSLFFKCENFQRGGSFKVRGASNLILSLSPEEVQKGVVAFSSGNHAQGVAIAAKHVGAPATIVMPSDAPQAQSRAHASPGREYCVVRPPELRIASTSPPSCSKALAPPWCRLTTTP